ncbi:MAG: ribonuclease HII, partial [Actinobacteria bacterium]|nr:ribonuclease HII [Actinomycetota bacterium]
MASPGSATIPRCSRECRRRSSRRLCSGPGRAVPATESVVGSGKDPTLDFELACFTAGASLVIGIDEVGRGAIAGPVAVGVHAVSAGTTGFPEGLRDSKLLSEKKRETLAPLVREWG